MTSEYTIQVTRKGGACVASISELCLTEGGKTPQEAVLAVLQAEEGVRKILEGQGVPLPPSAQLMDPFPKLTQWIARKIPFFAKIAIGYVVVVCVTALLLVTVFLSIRSKTEGYLSSDRAATDTGKVLSRLGVSLCLEKP